jgi:TPP-dependent pyruvate/acetoin dehydrogenase alpha subunit
VYSYSSDLSRKRLYLSFNFYIIKWQKSERTEYPMNPDIWFLYRHMLKSRFFEEAVIQLWQDGRISGEMHLGIGEEAINAGIVSQLKDGDAMALDHRGTPPLLMRGVDPVLLLREFLGQPNGLCSGKGGHMHLFSRQHLAASSGIVGASGPGAVGFALAAQHLRPGTLAVAFFGDGAVNQGMMLEAMNLAVVWKLPVLFVCKDNEWAITTLSPSVTGGTIIDRVKAFGMTAIKVDGTDVETVWQAAYDAMNRARNGEGPTFLIASCVHFEGHFLGDHLMRIARHPIKEMKPLSGSLLNSVVKLKGTGLRGRSESMSIITSLLKKAKKDKDSRQSDPLERTREFLKSDQMRLQELEKEVALEIQKTVENVIAAE